MYKVITFYKFVALTDCEHWQNLLRAFCSEHGIKGTVLLAQEGINSTVAGNPESITKMVDLLRSHIEFSDLTIKESFAIELPFQRLKIKIKPEIVTMKALTDPSKIVGRYIAAKDWNDFIRQKDVIVIDTRNSYEYAMGTFERAIDPETNIFSEFPNYVAKHLADKKDAPIAMFCTGGIRCEKATSYMIAQGFKNVYHLQGGILKYLEDVPAEQSLWRGECFIFDEREAIGHGLKNRKK